MKTHLFKSSLDWLSARIRSIPLYRWCRLVIASVPVVVLIGCSATGKITNLPVQQVPDSGTRYSFTNYMESHDLGNIMFILAFSGGGTRAAALSYGVLEELRDTSFEASGKPYRLLDEVDRISSVSGGSFTSAYYGLFGDRIFSDFKEVFLYKDIESELMSRVFGLFDTVGRSFSGESRTETVIDYYDKNIFEGRTFADLQEANTPYTLINATDLNSRSQFVFSQRQFDFLCSDLSEFSVARAVAASSAVPILFHPVLVEKHAACNFEKPEWLIDVEKDADPTKNIRLHELVESMSFYLDDDSPPYATLVDGGVTDNLGLRAIYRNMMLSGGALEFYNSQADRVSFEHIVVLVVNASTNAVTEVGKSQIIPSAFEVLTVMTDIQLHLYNTESNSLIKEELTRLIEGLSISGRQIEPYFIEISVEDIDDPAEQRYVNEIPTSFYLEREQADMLIATAKKLLRKDKGYQRLLKNIGADQSADNGQD